VQSAWATDMLPPHKQPKGGGACASALSCHLNGVCEANLCRCDAAWTGPLCGTLHLLPTAAGPHSGRAWPSAPNTSSWGGNVLEVDGSFHLYVSEMGGSCGLASWQHNSFVRHATALKPDGPYSEGEIVMAAFSHNAQAIRDHAGMIAVFHVGSGNPSPKGFITNCTNGTTPLPTPSRQRQPTEQEGAHGGAVARAPYSVPTSRSPGGPWTLTNLSCTGGPCPGFSNPSPHLLLNGTALLAWRTGGGGEDRSKWGMSIARAPGLFGPYTLLCDTPPCTNWSHPTWVPPAGHNCEDPFLWSDSRGGLHVMNHCYNQGDEGGHAFSEDGVHWHLSDVAPWTDSIHHTDVRLRLTVTQTQCSLAVWLT
jgi:hypothetical protein